MEDPVRLVLGLAIGIGLLFLAGRIRARSLKRRPPRGGDPGSSKD